MARQLTYALSLVALFGAALWPVRIPVKAQSRMPLLVVIAGDTGMTNIDSEVLRRAFEGYPTEFRTGKRLLPLNHPTGTPERMRFDQAVLGLGPEEVGLFWVDQRIRGVSQPPRTMATGELAVRVVASFPGAITYADPKLVSAAVKVLSVDGRAPGEPGYLFSR